MNLQKHPHRNNAFFHSPTYVGIVRSGMSGMITLGVILLLTVQQVKAQTFRKAVIGIVTDYKTGKPISDAKVYWKGRKEDFKRTDKYGVYRIDRTAEDFVLIFEHAGKERIPYRLRNDETEVNVYMEDIGKTSVTASRWEQSVNNIPASIILITRDEIEAKGYLTVQEILENVPGVFTIDHRSESDVSVGIRGFWAPFNRNVMIQVNGVNMLSERQNDFPLNKINVPVEAIDRIEMVRGPMSIIYGAGAFFGVINIITNDSDEENSGLVSLGYGTQNNQRAVVKYNANTEGLKLSFSSMTDVRNGFEQDWNDMISDSMYKSDPYRNDPEAQTVSDYQNQQVNKERYSHLHQSFNLTLATENGFFGSMNYAYSDFGFSFIQPGPSTRNPYISSTLNSQFGYRFETSNKRFALESRVSYMSSLVKATYRYFYDTSYTPGEDQVASLRTEVNARKVLLDVSDGNKVDLDLIGGVYFNRNLRNNSLYNAAEFGLRNWYIGLPDGKNLDTRAAYLQTTLHRGQFQFVAGARLEQQAAYAMENTYNVDIQDTSVTPVSFEGINPNDQVNFIPRVAIISALQRQGSSVKTKQFVRGMYGQAIKQATVIDNASDILSNDQLTEKNYLKPERIETVEFGYIVQNDSAGLEFNMNLFRNDLNDLVVRETAIQNGEYVTYSANSGRYVTRGIEFIGKKEFNISMGTEDAEGHVNHLILVTSADFTYQQTLKASQTSGWNDSVSFSPPVLGNINLTGKSGHVMFGLNMNYVGKMKAYINPRTETEDAHYIGRDTPGYFRLSANVRLYDLFSLNENDQGGFYVGARVSNVLNVKYYYPTYTNNDWADNGILGRPRQLLVSMGYKF